MLHQNGATVLLGRSFSVCIRPMECHGGLSNTLLDYNAGKYYICFICDTIVYVTVASKQKWLAKSSFTHSYAYVANLSVLLDSHSLSG